MGKYSKILTVLLLLILCGCGSDYIHYKTNIDFDYNVKLSKKEAALKFVKLLLKYKSSNEAYFRSVNSDYFDLYTKDLKETIGKKYALKKFIENEEYLVLIFSDENCKENDCLKGFFVQIFKKHYPKICNVRKVHKETKKEETYMELSDLMMSFASVEPGSGQLYVNYIVYNVELKDKNKMAELASIVSDVYGRKIICK